MGKMTAILSGDGGTKCQMCTATHQDLKDKDFVIDRFPIKRTIIDAFDLFANIEDTESFFNLPSNQLFNLTHEPSKNKFSLSTSFVYMHLSMSTETIFFSVEIRLFYIFNSTNFRRFNLLVYHLHIEMLSCSQVLRISNSQ